MDSTMNIAINRQNHMARTARHFNLLATRLRPHLFRLVLAKKGVPHSTPSEGRDDYNSAP